MKHEGLQLKMSIPRQIKIQRLIYTGLGEDTYTNTYVVLMIPQAWNNISFLKQEAWKHLQTDL